MINNLKNVLVVDDDSATVFLNKWIIEKLNFQGDFLAASNGQEALDILTFTSAPLDPYLILLDIHMPVMDGWEFLSHYQHLDTRQSTDIVILMVSYEEEARERLEREQFHFVTDCLRKPVRRKELASIIERHFK